MADTEESEELVIVRRHVHEGDVHIKLQCQIIEKLRANEHPTREAEKLLATFLDIQAGHLSRLALIERNMAPDRTTC